MGRLRQDVGYALRTFAKAPGFTVDCHSRSGRLTWGPTPPSSASSTSCSCGRSRAVPASWWVGIQPGPHEGRIRSGPFPTPIYVDIRDQSDVFDGSGRVHLHQGRHTGWRRNPPHRWTALRVLELLRHARRAAGRRSHLPTPEEERPGADTRVVIAQLCAVAAGCSLDPASSASTMRINVAGLHRGWRGPEGIHRDDGAPLGGRVSAARRFRHDRVGAGDEEQRPAGAWADRANAGLLSSQGS